MNSSTFLSAFLLGRTAPALFSVLGAALLSGCGAMDRSPRTLDISAAITAELPATAAPKPSTAVPTKVSDALAEPPPPAIAPAPEPRLDLLVNNAQAREVFLAIVADTRYSMLMHPDVRGTLSVTLRGVTVLEALEAIRDVYGYDFKMEGRRITVYAPTLQTRVFTLNYPTSQRQGSSELGVSSGAALQQSGSSTSGSNTANAASGAPSSPENTRVSTTSKSDFWGELTGAVKSMVGNGDGRSVVASPQAGILAVRAMPDELRHVDTFLKATQLSVSRQVMLEAKVIEVTLSEGYQSGVNWGALGSDGTTSVAAGVVGSTVSSTNSFVQGATTISGVQSFPSVAAGGGLFGLALSASGFGAVLAFLETQGDVQTLSSPRVATLNNQKAVLKVGTDEFFVTNVSGGSTSSSSSTTTSTLPSVTLAPFFSGISLDVTPQIDDDVNITLHVHPSLATVTETSKEIDLGSAGSFKLPLASRAVNETDTMVRIQDGSLVAIGGLMQLASSRNTSGVPGVSSLPGWGALFGNRAAQSSKKEVIVLIKPTIIRTAADWEAQGRRARAAIDDMDATRARVIQLDGSAK